jgi:predicted TIM-barrel fold metal-dependent hydrolase
MSEQTTGNESGANKAPAAISGQTKSAAIRAALNHPIIDTDGHMLEHNPVFLEFLKQVAGPDMVKQYADRACKRQEHLWYAMSNDERRDFRVARPPFWGIPSRNTRDRATSMLPRMMRDRLDEFGFDFSIVYPTLGFFLVDEADEDVRRAACRAYNTMVGDIFSGESDRLTPTACVPTGTPEEACEELEYAVKTCGLKTAMVASLVYRPLTAGSGGRKTGSYWIDPLGLDSEYDYDPFWAKCVELGVAPTAHAHMQGHGVRRSVSNFAYNQIGHFADAGEAFAKAMVMGGVTRRFPTLNIGVLEGGVGWAASLFSSLVEVWGKRSGLAVEQFNPTEIDLEELIGYAREYGTDVFKGTFEKPAGDGSEYQIMDAGAVANDDDTLLKDDFAACDVTSAEQFLDIFVKPFFFGCEADDPMTPIAFDGKKLPFGAKLQAIFGSDIGHWDVPDMTEVLEEAYEMVEDGHITEADFREFTFANPIRLHAGMNPNFFKGTVVEESVDAFMVEDGLGQVKGAAAE